MPSAWLPQVSRRAKLDASVHAAVQLLLARTSAVGLLRSKFGEQLSPEHARVLAESGSNAASATVLVDLLVSTALPQPAGAALVADWDCLRVRRSQHSAALRCHDLTHPTPQHAPCASAACARVLRGWQGVLLAD